MIESLDAQNDDYPDAPIIRGFEGPYPEQSCPRGPGGGGGRAVGQTLDRVRRLHRFFIGVMGDGR